MPYRFKSGSWQPARLRWIDHAFIMVSLIIIGFLRGLDYTFGNDVWGARDFMLTAARGWVWGGGFIIGAGLLAFGVMTARHLIVYIGHGWLGAAYGVNALALTLASGNHENGVLLAFLGMGVLAIVVATLHIMVQNGRGHLAFFIAVVVVATCGGGMVVGDDFDGVRGGGAVGIISAIHFIHMIRTGGRPLRIDAASPTTEGLVEGDGR